MQEDLFKRLVSHCKEYGFIYQSSEIYDGLNGVYDYGPMGVELKNNIKEYWWRSMVQMHENITGIDSWMLSTTRSLITRIPRNATAPMC
jgi:glycyl-tRNA synthetase